MIFIEAGDECRKRLTK